MGALDEVMDLVETPFAPITDRASTFGFAKWTKLCKANGKKPIYGVEIAVSPEPTAKKVTRSHFTFIALDSLTPLHRLLWRATSQFRYEPLLSYHDLQPGLFEDNMAGLAIIPGRNAILRLLSPKLPNLYVSAGPSTPSAQRDWATAHRVPLIASGDNYYPMADDREPYEVICGMGATTQTFPMHILSESELLAHCGRDAIMVRDALAERCRAELQPATLVRPERPASLAELCKAGASRLDCDLDDPVYSERLAKELALIRAKDFEDYFYIVADLVAEAKRRNIFVGPARGSSCGSLVCYLLGITTIDPIPFDLIFERFIDVNRADLPDIDIDFSDQRRHLVFKYLEDKYGKARVARLGSVALYKPKSAINEAAAALKVPPWRAKAFAETILDRSSGDARALQGVEDAFNDSAVGRDLLRDFPEMAIAMRMEGHPRHYSQHAAGIVITEREMEEHVAVDARTGNIHCDKKDAETLDLLKLDILGLTQLSIFEDCLAMIGKSHDWLINQPLDDPKAFAVLNEKKWSGVFQFMGDALQSIAQSVTISEIEDIIAITALARPGPLASGGTAQWIERKNGREPITYLHPLFEDILSTSLGIVVYQEQVMRVVREIGGFSWEDTSRIRKVMSDRKGAETFAREEAKFVAGAVANGLTSDMAKDVWKALSQYGSWAFNRSHSVAYGYVSYWCCILKAYFPLEFAAATLSHEDDVNKQLKALREMAREGVTYKPVDPVHSTDKWRVVDGQLVGPLTNVQGLGPKMLTEVMESRAEGRGIPKRAEKLLTNPITPIDELYPVTKRLQMLYPDGLEAANILTTPKPIIDCQGELCGGKTVLVVGRITDINPRNLNEPQLVAKRNGRVIQNNPDFLNLIIEDDTDQIRATVWGRSWDDVATPIIERGGSGGVLYAIKGKMGDGDFRAIDVDRAKYLGTMK